MSNKKTWLLPEGVEEILPTKAIQLEKLCRSTVDLMYGWGYDFVIPPLIEYIDSLLVDSGQDLDLKTFKIIDQLNGKTMGLRADTTPQIARINAHHLGRDYPTRLCYLGDVVHTRPSMEGGLRCPLQLGAELYGDQSASSDIEIINLMLAVLQQADIAEISLELGHVQIYRIIANSAGLSLTQQYELFNVLQRKASSELKELLTAWQLETQYIDELLYLSNLYGGLHILEDARQYFSAHAEILVLLDEIDRISQQVLSVYPDLTINIDLAELRGYQYHTGVVFTVYSARCGRAIATGGRYDAIAKQVSGDGIAATGFSTDMKTLIDLSSTPYQESGLIFAPAVDDTELESMINSLREDGQRVVRELAGQQANAATMNCTQELVKQENSWVIKNIS